MRRVESHSPKHAKSNKYFKWPCRRAEYSYSAVHLSSVELAEIVIVKNSLRTAALSFGIAVLFGSAAVVFAQTTNTTSSSETTTEAPAPVAVYPAPVVVAPAPIVVAVPAPAVVEPATTSEHNSSSSSTSNSPAGDSTEHTSSSSTSNYQEAVAILGSGRCVRCVASGLPLLSYDTSLTTTAAV